jgi:UDP-glucuronate decarboxylase
MSLGDGRVVSNFIIQSLQNLDLTVYGDGKQTRSFCFVDDLIDGITKLFFSEGIYEPVNLGNPVPTSMISLAEEIIELTNSKSKIVFKPIPEDDPKLREPDITKAKKLINWEPVIGRSEGLLQTIAYFKELLRD